MLSRFHLLVSKDIGKDILGGVKQTLSLTRGPISLLPIPGLSLVIDAVLSIISTIENASGNKKQFQELAIHIQTLITYVLTPIVSAAESTSNHVVTVPEDLQQRINTLSGRLIEITEEANTFATYSRTRHFLRNAEFSVSLKDLNTKVDTALTMFRLGGDITKEMLLGKVEKTLRKISSDMIDQTQRGLLDKLPYALAQFSASKASECQDNTRTELLQVIYQWMEKESVGNRPLMFICWLCGRPGEGKSTVAMTVATHLDRSNRLGASFFFSRDDKNCNNFRHVLPTIARQLAFFDSNIAFYITDFLKSHPDAGSDSIHYQLQHLIIDPLRKAHSTTPLQPFVIILDALDECVDSDQTPSFLRLLATEFGKLSFPVLFFITSRPELDLEATFNSKLVSSVLYPIRLHNIEHSTVTKDIRLYLEMQLEQITTEHPRAAPNGSWVHSGDIDHLVERASGLFIYAATAVKFIRDADRIPDKQMRILLSDVQSANAPKEHQPYALIDRLYHQILDNAIIGERKDLTSEIHTVIGTVVTLQSPLPYDALELFLQTKVKFFNLYPILRRLSSVIHYSPSDDNGVRVWHQSFPDFLARCTDARFHIDPKTHHTQLARLSLQLLLDFLRKEMGFNDPSRFNSEVPDVEKSIPRHVGYACVHFAYHVSQGSSEDEEIQNLIETFFATKVLNWFEALSLISRLDTAIGSLQQLHTWYKACLLPDGTTEQLIYDAERFILQFFDPISQSAVHVYHSALSFAPHSTLLEMYEGDHATSRVTLMKGRDRQWSPCMRIIEGHSSYVHSVAHSSDNCRIVSGSSDKTIRVWDATSGAMQATLLGHSGPVLSVAFSSDNSRIVSGSLDKTVRVWDSTSGALQATLQGHSENVSSVAFSSDNSRIISGSSDMTVRVWGVASGAHLATLQGHSSDVNSVAFSYNDARIISGGDDGIICMWDSTSGAHQATLQGHTDIVFSVAFSSDNSRIVSGSYDKTVRIWDTTSGTLQAILRGHSSGVRSVAFSCDNSKIISGSSDMTVRVWDAASSTHLATFQGHSDFIFSVVISSDNSRIISGSADKTLRLWDATSCALQVTPQAFFFNVYCVAFSSDNSRIASGSDDDTVRMWDATSGILQATLEGHSGTVRSVAFSANNTRLVSGSEDKTIRVWDATSGTLQASLEGHSSFVQSVAFSSDDCRIVSGSYDNTIQVWDATSGARRATLTEHSSAVLSVAFSSDNSRIISGSADSTIRVWDATSGVVQAVLQGHSDFVLSVVFSSDNSRIISRCQDKTIRVWDSMSGTDVTVPSWKSAERLISDSFLLDNLGWIIAVASGRHERICWVPVSLREYLRARYSDDVTGRMVFQTVPDTSFVSTTIVCVVFSVS